ncbi:MAG: hypothetical protein ABIM99_04375 [Candidatus Dojkabacteria bacterium]
MALTNTLDDANAAREAEKEEYIERYSKTGVRIPRDESRLRITQEELGPPPEGSPEDAQEQGLLQSAAQSGLQKGEKIVANKAKQILTKVVLYNPYFRAAIVIAVLVSVLVIVGVLLVKKLQDDTGVSVANICKTFGTETCYKTMSDKLGEGLNSSTK